MTSVSSRPNSTAGCVTGTTHGEPALCIATGSEAAASSVAREQFDDRSELLDEGGVDGDVGSAEGVPPPLQLVGHFLSAAAQHRQRVVRDQRGRVGSEELLHPGGHVIADHEYVEQQLERAGPWPGRGPKLAGEPG